MRHNPSIERTLYEQVEPVPVSLPKECDGFGLRNFTRADAEALAEIEFDPDVKRYLALPKKARAEWVSIFDADAYGGWAVEVGGALAGRASILRARRKGESEIAIVISRSYWGQRLGRRVAEVLVRIAFEDINANVLVAEVHPQNDASLALLRALKFRRTGIVSTPGSWQDGHLVYRKTRSSYNQSLKLTPGGVPMDAFVAGA